MPFLFIALGQKLGIDVTAALAPAHMFVKYRDDAGRIFNLEATDKAAFRTDADYQRFTPMTAKALTNGVYMRALSKRETVVAMMETLMQAYQAQGNQQEQILLLTEVALNHHPKSTGAMLFRGNAYFDLMKRDFGKYQRLEDIPASELPRFKELQRNNVLWGDKAAALGWSAPSAQLEARYLQYIARVRSAH